MQESVSDVPRETFSQASSESTITKAAPKKARGWFARKTEAKEEAVAHEERLVEEDHLSEQKDEIAVALQEIEPDEIQSREMEDSWYTQIQRWFKGVEKEENNTQEVAISSEKADQETWYKEAISWLDQAPSVSEAALEEESIDNEQKSNELDEEEDFSSLLDPFRSLWDDEEQEE